MTERRLWILPLIALAITALPMAGVAQQTEAQSDAALAETEQQLEQARRELESARREMEAAAREISRLSTAGHQMHFIRGPGGSARIGANIQDAETGALVIGVTPGGPAEEAGVLSGDIILGVNGVATVGAAGDPTETVRATLAEIDPGAMVPIELSRAGEVLSVVVETREPEFIARWLGNLPSGDNFDFDFVMPDFSGLSGLADPERIASHVRYFDMSNLFASRWHDMELVTLSAGLGDYFGTDAGLLVVRAPETDDLDLSDGDVILTISGRTPRSPEHAMRILSSFVPGESLELEIMRQQRRRTIDYTIPDPRAAADEVVEVERD